MRKIDPDKTPVRGIAVSAEQPKVAHGDPRTSGRVRVDARNDGLATAVRAALELAHVCGNRVSVALRGDAANAIAVRVIEGTVELFDTTADGRARVRIAIASDAEQVILLDRIVGVTPLR